MAVQARREYTSVVDNQDVLRPQKIGELHEPAILPEPRLAIQVKHPRSGPFRQGLLRNQLWRQVIVKVRDEHRGIIELKKWHSGLLANVNVEQ
jgi:hypothetical protein